MRKKFVRKMIFLTLKLITSVKAKQAKQKFSKHLSQEADTRVSNFWVEHYSPKHSTNLHSIQVSIA